MCYQPELSFLLQSSQGARDLESRFKMVPHLGVNCHTDVGGGGEIGADGTFEIHGMICILGIRVIFL